MFAVQRARAAAVGSPVRFERPARVDIVDARPNPLTGRFTTWPRQ